ncbi:MAG: NAD-dependent epimerase/dehydratase family protein, partial [Gemmatimonadaceae bacterium]
MTHSAGLKCFVAGHRGLLGSAVVRALAANGYPAPIVRTRDDLDLLDQRGVQRFFREQQPDVVFVAAARVGGINANNTYRW